MSNLLRENSLITDFFSSKWAQPDWGGSDRTVSTWLSLFQLSQTCFVQQFTRVKLTLPETSVPDVPRMTDAA